MASTRTRSKSKSSKKTQPIGSHVRMRGFARLQFFETDPLTGVKTLVGDSGWIHNTITNDGKDNYVVNSIRNTSQKTPSHLAIATQTAAVAAADTSLIGEIMGGTKRKAPTMSLQSVGTLRMTASWSSADITTAYTIGSIAVYNTSAGGTMGSGQTYATSQWQTNQDVSATYEWRF